MALTYTGEQTREISFPLGGIGSGCIGLGGDGRLRDWEIFNRPNKGSLNGFSHFAVRAEDDNGVVDARLLHGDLAPPYSGELTGRDFTGFGFGPRRENLAGMPHFRDTEFDGEFPFGTVRYLDETFPAAVSLRAFNPFIPLAEDDSSLPAAFFEVSVTNTSGRRLRFTAVGCLSNPASPGNSRHLVREADAATILSLDSPATAVEAPESGGLAIGVASDPGCEISYQQYWYRGRWFDGLGVYWRELTTPGPFANRVYDDPNLTDTSDTATLASTVTLESGATHTVRYVIAWYYPNCTNYWSGDAEASCECDGDCNGEACDCGGAPGAARPTWKNYYATRFESAGAVASHALSHWDTLTARTERFRDALFGSSLPPEVTDAISANISILKSPTCLRLTDGSFYGFEGCHGTSGCCEGSCTHVWNYAYALPFLFPRLERSMRALDYRHNQGEDGRMSFRLQLPVGSGRWDFRACVDGQMGGVIKTYREWKVCGDAAWLASVWPAVRRSIEFAWAATNEDRWDPGRSGVITGRQHHTLDMELFGPSSWLNGFYLAALKAGAEMAAALGESETAAEYLEIFARGKERTDRELFNGEYYIQTVDLDDRSILERFLREGDRVLKGGSLLDSYWDAEHGEIKYQVGEGSAIDQVVAQWHANLTGLGEILDPGQTRSALAAIYLYNYKPTLRFHANPCRTFGLNDEAGTVICEWPEGTRKPYVPVPYSEETMHGFEYQAACHMIQEGMVDEGLELVSAVRDRYDGERRNPWNEIECGSNYARSMASYALLLAFSGFSCDMTRGHLGFNPIRLGEGPHRFLWSVDAAWGTVEFDGSTVRLPVVEGAIELASLGLGALGGEPSRVTVAGREVRFTWSESSVRFAERIRIGAGETLWVEAAEGQARRRDVPRGERPANR